MVINYGELRLSMAEVSMRNNHHVMQTPFTAGGWALFTAFQITSHLRLSMAEVSMCNTHHVISGM